MVSKIRNKLKGYIKYTLSKVKSINNYIYCLYLRIILKNFEFTIISNNCWGGGVYEDLNLMYRTPTVGLFFFTPCYIKFVKDLENNLKKEINFTNKSKYVKANEIQNQTPYPIGLIDDIEIHFLHYQSAEDAYAKWERRKKRINYNNIFLVFSDVEDYNIQDLLIYDQLPYKKVFFSSKQIPGIKSLIWLKKFESSGRIGDIYSNKWDYRRYFNISKWLNRGYNNKG